MNKVIPVSSLGISFLWLPAHGSFRELEKLVRTAIDVGITHFDLAPTTGSDDAELAFGKILKHCPEKVTITTKGALLAKPRGVMTKKAPGIDQLLKEYTPGVLTRSLQDSVAKIGRPVDMFLLPGVTAEFATNSGVVNELTALKAGGFTSSTGIVGDVRLLAEIMALLPGVYHVGQLVTSLQTAIPLSEVKTPQNYLITQRSIAEDLARLQYLLEFRPGFQEVWLRVLGPLPITAQAIARLMMEIALYENRQGTVLFSGSTPEHLRELSAARDQASWNVEQYLKIISIVRGLTPQEFD